MSNILRAYNSSISKYVCLVTQLCMTLCNPMKCSLPGSSIHGVSPGKNTEMGCHALLQGVFPNQGSNGSPALQVDSVLTKPPGKPISKYPTAEKQIATIIKGVVFYLQPFLPQDMYLCV